MLIKVPSIVLCLMLAAPLYAADKVFYVYSDSKAPGNHFIPSGWMGDYGDLKYEDSYENPRGKSCIKIKYNAKGAQQAGWAGIFWQDPQNNWGTKKGGYNLSGYKKLTFWARGDKGGETIAEAGMGGITGEFPDSASTRIYLLHLTGSWHEYTVDLSNLDLSHIIGGFVFTFSRDDNPDGAEIFLDDIRYE